jgi:trigger factor
MAAIARKLSIQVTEDDIRQGIEELAAESGKNVAKVRAEYNDPQRRNILIGMILEDKVLNVIESKAVVRDGETTGKLAASENANIEELAEPNVGATAAPMAANVGEPDAAGG